MRYKEPKNKKYILSPYWISAIASGLAKTHQVKIMRGERWAMDMKTKTLHYTDDICFLDRENVLALLLHEIGHLRFSEWYDESTAIYKEAPEASANCINACEDVRIDFMMSRMYEGSYSLIDTLHYQSVADGLKQLSTYQQEVDKHQVQLDKFKRKIADAKMATEQGRVTKEELQRFIQDNEPQLVGRMNPVAECMYLMLAKYQGFSEHPTIKAYHNKEIVEKADLCVKELEKHQVEYMESTKEVQDFYEEYIYPIIKDLIEKNADGSEKKFEKPQGGGQTDANGNPVQGNGQPKGNAYAQAMAKKAQELKGKAEEAIEKLHGQKPAHDRPSDGNNQINYNEFYDAIADSVNTSGAKFNRILKDNKFDRYTGRFRTGELNKRRLYKWKSQDYRIFQRRVERQNKDYAFSILMDTSGSMQGTQGTESMKGVVLMSEVLNRCKVPYEVAFFSSGHQFGKEFNQPLSRAKVGQAATAVWGGGTDIYEPFKNIVEHMAGRKERHKVVVVLTDGEVGSDQERESLRLMKKHGDIHYYGIGIGVKLDRLFRENHVEVNEVKDIIPEFAAILKEHIKIG